MLSKLRYKLGVVAYACLKSQYSGGRDRRTFLSSRPAWSIEQVLGQPRVYKELCLKNKVTNKN